MIILTDKVVNKQHVKRAMQISLSLLDTLLTERENVTRLIKYIFIINVGFSFKTKGRVLPDEN